MIFARVCNIFSEPINNRIHNIIIADELYLLAISAKHMKGCIDELINIKIFWGGKPLFVKDFRSSCHTVYTETYYFLTFVAQPHDIISVAIPHET